MTGHLITIEDKSIWIFCNASQSLYVVVFRVQTKYISFFHVSVLLILFTFDHSAFWPIARLLIVLSLCGHFKPVTCPVCLYLFRRSTTTSLMVWSCPDFPVMNVFGWPLQKFQYGKVGRLVGAMPQLGRVGRATWRWGKMAVTFMVIPLDKIKPQLDTFSTHCSGT